MADQVVATVTPGKPIVPASLPFTPAVELPALTRSAALAYLSPAFDLAESQPSGHAVTVALIALAVGRQLGLSERDAETTRYGALLHDAGISIGRVPERVADHGGHMAAGGWVASRFGLNEDVQRAIVATHERWDGEGRAQGLAMSEIPLPALLISAAHWAADLNQEFEYPLLARASLRERDFHELDSAVGSDISRALAAVLREDATWLAMQDDRLAALLGMIDGGGEASAGTMQHVARVMGEVVDAAAREPGRSERVAALAVALAERCGMTRPERDATRVAAHLLDIGLLGVPTYITEKPSILSVDEMETLRRYPGWGSRIIAAMPGMGEVARWVEAHHERIDSRGYPAMLEAEEIPLASRILAIADSYWALRAPRPYRDAFTPADALATIHAAVGEQYDAEIAAVLRETLSGIEAAA